MERCNYELFVEKYYGLNPETTTENGIIKTDFGDLCNLLAMFDNERGKADASDESSGLNKPVVMPSLLDLNFKKMRKAKGLTLREVEKSTGISNAYLSQFETGKIKSPGYNTVKALLELYSNEA